MTRRSLRRALIHSLTLAFLTQGTTASALTPAEAYHKATQFLRTQGAAGWESVEAQPVLLGEAVAGDPLAAGPRSTTLLASLELGSVDARARRARALAALGLRATEDVTALLSAQELASGFGVSADYLPSPLDTALAVQALDATGAAPINAAQASFNYLKPAQLTSGSTSGMWPLLRKPDAAGGGAAGDVATTAQVVLAWAARKTQPGYSAQFANAITALRAAAPTRASDRALRLLALLEGEPTAPTTATALNQLVAMQQSDGSFGSESSPADRVYATALAARAIGRAGTFASFPFDSDGDTIADGPDPDSDNDGICDPGESGAGCTGTDAFPTDATEWADLDRDGVGDNTDPDRDGDGIANGADDYPALAQERLDADQDGTPDTADIDDDNDGLLDVDELLAGLDPRDADTDGDSFRDNVELAKGRDPLDAADRPLPDGDVFPLGPLPDGVVDARDELLIHRVLRGLVTVPPADYETFLRHADVAPLVGGQPSPGNGFDAADAMVLTRRVRGMVAGW
jgi:hypothetical protein